MLSPIIPALVADNPQSIKAYFEKVRELAKSGNPYPVSLDDVWPLCYERKDNAVKILKADFKQGYDYQSLRQKAERARGATRRDIYSLSVSCMEWLVARKVRPIFDVYREVFHRVADVIEQTLIDRQTALVCLTNSLIEKIEGLEGKIDRLNKSREKYFKAKVVERAAKVDEEVKQKRDRCIALVAKIIDENYYTMNWKSRWDTIWKALLENYGFDIKKYEKHVGEHYIDVAIRRGFFDQTYEYIISVYGPKR